MSSVAFLSFMNEHIMLAQFKRGSIMESLLLGELL